MSVLAWLFGLGALAAVFPFLFHLIRRTPKGQVPFSSLMFLKPSPPRLTKRSRLENLLLLALRVAAIALIAVAFMRPYFKSNLELSFSDLPGQKTAILLDTSASMQRGDLWTQSLARVKKIVDSAGEKDKIAVYTFDSELVLRKPLGPKVSGSGFRSHFNLDDVEPGWSQSNLGLALLQVADEFEQKTEQASDKSKSQLIVITDLQVGSSTSALQNYQWPASIKVDFEQVVLKEKGNASIELLPVDETDSDAQRENALVKNAKTSATDRFEIAWHDSKSGAKSNPVSVFVPPGSNKILRVPRDANSLLADEIKLIGDAAAFDNQFLVVPPSQQKLSVSYLGNEEEDDPESMLYYLDRALMDTPLRSVEVVQHSTEKPISLAGGTAPDLIVVTRAVIESEQEAINNLLLSGATLFVVLSDAECLDSTREWTEVLAKSKFDGGQDDRYSMLGQIDFSHPVFEPFAGPRFNDFTQIRFWKHLKAKLSDNVQVLAWFDDDSPAFWHRLANSKSNIYVLGTGWQPSHSQFALSSKFLPMVNRMLELSARSPQVFDSWTIGSPMEVSEQFDQVSFRDSKTPEYKTIQLEDEGSLKELIREPGIYTFSSTSDSTVGELRVAVNIDPAESLVETMPLEQITAFDVQVGRHDDASAQMEKQRKLRDGELENNQKLWKWLILAAIAFIIFESWLAGRTDRANTVNEHLALEDAV